MTPDLIAEYETPTLGYGCFFLKMVPTAISTASLMHLHGSPASLLCGVRLAFRDTSRAYAATARTSGASLIGKWISAAPTASTMSAYQIQS